MEDFDFYSFSPFYSNFTVWDNDTTTHDNILTPSYILTHSQELYLSNINQQDIGDLNVVIKENNKNDTDCDSNVIKDEKYKINVEEYKTILKIHMFFIKKRFLSYLENPTISAVSKTTFIEKYGKKNMISNQNMKNGGLFKDFDFDEIE
jgi:hypothetical protein